VRERGSIVTLTAQSWADATAEAIQRAAREHGRPNTFSPGELFYFYGGPAPRFSGHAMTHNMVYIWRSLGGREKWGSCPRYDKGRVAV
jgi:hypothetical protein